MKQLGLVALGILTLYLLLGPFRTPILNGIKGWRTVDTTQSFAVTTAGGVSTGTVTLTRDLFQANVANINSIISSASELPVATGYTEATRILALGGLAEGTSRTLTVRYDADSDDDTMRAIGPFLVLLIFGFLIGLTIYSMVHKPGRRG